MLKDIFLKKKLKKLPKGKIIMMCDDAKCPRYKIVDKERYEPVNAKVIVVACPWHERDTELIEYLDKNLLKIS